MKGLALAATAAFAMLLSARADAACEQEIVDARGTRAAATFVRAAECLRTSGQIDQAISVLEEARRIVQFSDFEEIDARIAGLRTEITNHLTSRAVTDPAYEEALEALRGADQGDLDTARKLALAAHDLARTADQLDEVARQYARLNGVPKFSLDGAFHTSILGFIGSGSSVIQDRFFNTKNALAYSVQPIVLGGASAHLRFFDPDGWELVKLRLGYETDRLFGSGGQSASNTLAKQLGVTGVAADVIDGALAYSGIGVEGEYATFTNGRVRRIDVPSNTVVDDAPLRFTRTRLEGTFNVTPLLWKKQETRLENQRSQLRVHALYYRLGIPRIAYLTQQDVASSSTIVVAESEPQTIDVALGAAGASGRLATGNDRATFGVILTLMLGGGQVSFDMPARLGEPAGPNNRVRLHAPTFALVSRAGLYGDVRIAGDTYAAYLGGSLSAEQYYAEAKVPGGVAGSVGFADAFYTALITATVRYRSFPSH